MSIDNVFAKTRELAHALIESEAYQNMKIAEEKAMKSPEAAETLAQLMEKRSQLENLITKEDFDAGEMKRLSTEIDELQVRLQMMDDIAKMTAAREEFSSLMAQVNQVLTFVITGQMDEGGCTGSCSSCSSGCPSAKN